jgi:hypothetical protein
MQNTAADCPLAYGRPLTPSRINALIFQGRQEGAAHKDLVALLGRLAAADPKTDQKSLGFDKYEPPTPEMKVEFPHGRFPDVSFNYSGKRVVLEAQLATIALHGINGRRDYYDRMGATLLWVMRNFDPTAPMRASVRDIVADQKGMVLSVDGEVVERSSREGAFHLRVWTYTRVGDEEAWTNEVLNLSEVIEKAKPRSWRADFKQRIVNSFENIGIDDILAPDYRPIVDEALIHIGKNHIIGEGQKRDIFHIICILVSLEQGKIIGSSARDLVAFVNHFDYSGRHRYRELVLKAIRHWRPDLLTRPSMQTALLRAEARMKQTGERPYGRSSPIGQLRDLLFPEWVLGSASPLKAPG